MIRINVAPPPEARARRKRFEFRLPAFNLGILFGILYVIAVAGIGWYWWTESEEAARLDREVARAQQELAALKTTIGQGAKVKELLPELQKRVKAIQELTKDQARPIRLLDAFVEVVPRELWITGFEEKGAVLRITGSAFTTTAVSDFMSNLKASGKFKDVDIVVSRQDLVKPPRLVTFEVTCRFES